MEFDVQNTLQIMLNKEDILGKISNQPVINKVIKWKVNDNFVQNLIFRNISLDPLHWNASDVQHWIKWVIRIFKLPGIALKDWDLCGNDLCNLTLATFKQKVPFDDNDYFWTHLQIMLHYKIFAVPKINEHESNKVVKAPTIYLWQFLLELLIDEAYSEIIRWEGEDGSFYILQPEIVAQLWGVKKRKKGMTYDKFSRALRFYYRENMIQKVTGKKNYYKFTCDIKELIGFSPKEFQEQMCD